MKFAICLPQSLMVVRINEAEGLIMTLFPSKALTFDSITAALAWAKANLPSSYLKTMAIRPLSKLS